MLQGSDTLNSERATKFGERTTEIN